MMDAAQNTSRNSRDLILDAAEALVSELGAARLTIDAVAARSGLSKGGVLYNFPSKDALIKGMVARLIEDCASDIAGLRPRFEEYDSPTLAALVTAAPGWISAKKSVARALLAAHAENPALLQPFCAFKQTQKTQILSETTSPADALMIWSAIEGVVFTSALGLNVHSEAEIETMLCGMREKIRG
jgi:AcrR family transcriptional regulator